MMGISNFTFPKHVTSSCELFTLLLYKYVIFVTAVFAFPLKRAKFLIGRALFTFLNISHKDTECISQKPHSCARICAAHCFAIRPSTSSNIEKRFSIFQVFNLFHHNGLFVTIKNWPMKFVEVCVLENLRMTRNKGHSGVFELNISVYFT